MRIFLSTIISVLVAATGVMAQPLPVPAVPNAVLAPPPVRKPAPVTPQVEDGVILPRQELPALSFRAVRIEGATLLPQAALTASFQGLIDKEVSAAQLRGALSAIDNLYAKAGYALGRAYIPPQKMQDGVLTIRVVEGYVGAVVVQTETPRIKDTVARYAARILASKPLRTAELDRYLRLIAEIPGVTASAKLTDMELASGKAVLIITVTYQPISTALALSNDGNLHSLPIQPYLTLRANNLTGAGDQFALTALLSPPKDEYFLQGSASTLIGSDGMRLTSTTSVARARANIEPRSLNLSSTQLRSELKLGYPVIKSAMEQLTASGGVYFSQLRYDLNHLHIAKDRAFSAFGEVSEVKQFSDKWSASAYGRLTAGFELPYGSGMPRSRANSARDFGKFNLNAAAAYSVTPDFSLLLRADGQAATGSLMAAEEISYGGERFGRGYEAASVSGDHGIALSIQPQYSFTIVPGWNSSLFAFGDYARVFNTRGDLQGDATLLSLGGGIGVSQGSYSVSVGVGQPMEKVPYYAQRLRPRFFVSLQAKI